ncbi:uncharacterized protein VNE69_11053 [Vairimorpha necatrix]|uniref:Uncharacterized protein n=1 Tax=Vairimorpha necatrix TaxID=6039 RepID=A0AAX4JFZ1_9MICR
MLIVQGYQDVYNKLYTLITEKIKNRDYWEISNEKKYLRIKLSFDYLNYQLDANILEECNILEIIEEEKRILVNSIERSIQDIVVEFEDKLLHECEILRPDFIVLIYNPACCQHNVFKQIIDFLIQKNLARRNSINRSDLLYEYIIEDISLWNVMFVNLYKQEYNNDFSHQKIPLTFSKRGKQHYVNFCIEVKNIKHLFEINAEEIGKESLYTWKDTCLEKNKEVDRKIGNYFHMLYKNIYVDNIDNYSMPFFKICTPYKIELFIKKFRIEIIDDEIHLGHRNENHIFIPNRQTTLFGKRYANENKWITEFKRVFKKIHAIDFSENRCKGVEMFFRLIRYLNKVDFFIERILNAEGSPMNVLLAHLLHIKGLINRSELKNIINIEGLIEEKKIQLCKELEKSLSTDRCNSISFLLKIFLFIEGEKYINKNRSNPEPNFKILKMIGALIKSKGKARGILKKIESGFFINKNKIDLAVIYDDLVKNHFQDYQNSQSNLWKEVFKIASLFTGLESTRCEINDHTFYTLKGKIIREMGLDKYEVEKNNKIIQRTLFEKN